jgi:hypothetical protein
MPGGRPSTYPEGDEERRRLFTDILRLAQAGKSLAQISAQVDIPRTTMITWGDEHEEFSTVLTRAKELEQAWWEDQAQLGLTADRFNAAVWSKSVTSRFRGEYAEKREVDLTSSDGSMTPRGDVEETRAAIKSKLAGVTAPRGAGSVS